MKKNPNKLLLVLILTLPTFILSGCEDTDWDLLEIAFEAWAEDKGLYENGKWKPEGVVKNAVNETIADITNQEESVQLDGLNVIRDIEKADKLADQALTTFDTAKMASALVILVP